MAEPEAPPPAAVAPSESVEAAPVELMVEEPVAEAAPEPAPPQPAEPPAAKEVPQNRTVRKDARPERGRNERRERQAARPSGGDRKPQKGRLGGPPSRGASWG